MPPQLRDRFTLRHRCGDGGTSLPHMNSHPSQNAFSIILYVMRTAKLGEGDRRVSLLLR